MHIHDMEEKPKYILLKMREDKMKTLLEAYDRNHLIIDNLHNVYISQIFKDFRKIYKEKFKE